LDNPEQVVDAVGDLDELLARCARLAILATSRTALRLRAEREYPVAPLLVTADPDTLPDQGPGARLAAGTPPRVETALTAVRRPPNDPAC